MGAIVKRKNKDGSFSYRAEIKITQAKTVVFKAIKTFSSKHLAAKWLRETEAEFHAGGPRTAAPIPIAQLLERYAKTLAAIKPMRRTRAYLLRQIQESALGQIDAYKLTPNDLIQHCLARKNAGAGPSTIILDYSLLHSVFDKADHLLNLPLTAVILEQARPTLLQLGLIAKSRKRARRPTEIELERLLTHCRLRAAKPGSILPLADLLEFAIYSCMRQGEITRIQWNDVNEFRKTVLIRDRKSPQQKEGNHQEVPLLGPAWNLLQRQPRIDDRIFPYNPRSVSTAFTRLCAQLGIQDLRYHDLRREGASRLLEMGYSVAEVATVTGHADLNILWQVYTAIHPESLHQKWKPK